MGVSTPFQLQQVGSLALSNVCGMDDGEDGMVVVCSSESLFHDKINKVYYSISKLFHSGFFFIIIRYTLVI